MRIFLVGYMASGKTTIGRLLAKKLSFEFIDLDHYIELKEDMSVSNIFQLKGEVYFRQKESKYLKEVITKNRAVITVGGGTPCYGQNLELLINSPNTQSFYLKASLNILTERLYHDKNKRPLIAHVKDRDKLKEFIGKHLFERYKYYEQAKVSLNIDHKSVDQIVEEIIFSLF